ncbi:MAG: ParB/RepB/Spo0J family partition protein [Bacteroidales bacterium]|nr:ParB/RepB/Spo0J family partition protein [Bacteroidales bacterium]
MEIDRIETNPYQPRSKFDDEKINELASSIKELGIIQPITIRSIEKNLYQLITGERRLRAARIAGLKRIPAYIRLADDQAMLELALVENIQREDLDAIEVSISYQRLIEECSLTQENLSERVGKKRSTISNYLRLLKLPGEIQLGLRDKKISMGHARALVNIDDVKTQINAYYSIINEDLSVRKTEDMVRKINKSSSPSENVSSKEKKEILIKDFEDLQDQLSSFFSTKVQFRMNEQGKGKIVIPFKSGEELEEIMGVFDKIKP